MAAEHHVVRLDVAVQDARLVGGVQSIQDLEPDPRRLARAQRALLERRAEGAALDELHDDPRLAVLDRHVMDVDDRGVVQPRRGPRLAPHALEGGRPLPLGQVVGDPRFLDRDLTVDRLVLGPPDRAHAAGTELGQQPVAARDQPARARIGLHRLLRGDLRGDGVRLRGRLGGVRLRRLRPARGRVARLGHGRLLLGGVRVGPVAAARLRVVRAALLRPVRARPVGATGGSALRRLRRLEAEAGVLVGPVGGSPVIAHASIPTA